MTNMSNEAILNVGSDIVCGAILGSTIGFVLALKLLASSERLTFNLLLLGGSMTLVGSYTGALAGGSFFNSSQHYKNNLAENLTQNIVDTVNRIAYGK